jgi:hypothetical protein
MNCPNCAQELLDETSCQYCHLQDPSPLASEDFDEQDVSVAERSIAPPPPPEDTFRTADPQQPAPDLTDTATVGQKSEDPAMGSQRVKLDLPGSLSAGGDINVLVAAIEALNREDQPHRIEEEKPLYDFVKKLPRRSTRLYGPSPEELIVKVDWLRQNRLLLISSPHPEFAFDAAWAVIEALPGSPQRFNGTLSFQDVSGSNLEFSLQKLFEQRPEAEAESVLLVDALSGAAESFPTSFLGHSARTDSLKEALRNERHFLIVIVDLSYARRNNLASHARQNDLGHQIFPYWEVPFLEPFIKRKYPPRIRTLPQRDREPAETRIVGKGGGQVCSTDTHLLLRRSLA